MSENGQENSQETVNFTKLVTTKGAKYAKEGQRTQRAMCIGAREQRTADLRRQEIRLKERDSRSFAVTK
jgi:hypothetical protein